MNYEEKKALMEEQREWLKSLYLVHRNTYGDDFANGNEVYGFETEEARDKFCYGQDNARKIEYDEIQDNLDALMVDRTECGTEVPETPEFVTTDWAEQVGGYRVEGAAYSDMDAIQLYPDECYLDDDALYYIPQPYADEWDCRPDSPSSKFNAAEDPRYIVILSGREIREQSKGAYHEEPLAWCYNEFTKLNGSYEENYQRILQEVTEDN